MKNTLNEQELDMVNGGSLFGNKYTDNAYKRCGIKVEKHFFGDKFILEDGKVVDMSEANKIVYELEAKYWPKNGRW